MTADPVEQRLHLGRPPQNKEELWWVVFSMFGVALPRQAVCPGHVAPFDAFAEAYFGNPDNWMLWYGSRGTGKSYMLALLALVKSSVLEIQVTLLGGSMAQSQNVQEHVENLMLTPNAPKWAVTKQIQSELGFGEATWIRPLPASQKTVRGPHPHMTLLDEIDEMEKDVYDAAMGQALEKPNARGFVIPEMVVASSTWQNPVGTFQEVFDEAVKKGLPVRTWCYKEVLKSEANPTGWMSPAFIERKRRQVPAEMFRVEYDLGEPAGGSRAFDLTRLEEVFTDFPIVSELHKGDDDEWVFEEPQPTGYYAAGADWAKERDKTVIVVCRMDQNVRRIVYLRRINRRPWPEMAKAFNDTVTKYGAVSAHDGTGIGNVVADLIDERSHKFVMVGRPRTELLVEYIAAVENRVYDLPRNCPAYGSHKATTVNEVYAPGKWNSHLADDVAAFALMHNAAERQAPVAAGQGVPRTDFYPKGLAPVMPTGEQGARRQGEVWVVEEEWNPYVVS